MQVWVQLNSPARILLASLLVVAAGRARADEPERARYRPLQAEAEAPAGQKAEAVAQYVRAGDMYAAKGSFALAAEAYENAIKLRPPGEKPDGILHFKLAAAYVQLNQDLGNVTVRRVEGAQAGHIVGAWYLLEAVPEARDTFRVCPAASAIYQVHKAIELGLSTPEMHRLRGDIWLRVRRPAEALVSYRRIDGKVEAPHRAAFEFSYAQAALGADDLETYLERLRRASELDRATYGGRLAEGYRTAARRCSQRGDLGGAIRYLELATRERPESAGLRYRLGNAYWEANRRSDAARQWQIALELEPDHPNRSLMLDRIRG